MGPDDLRTAIAGARADVAVQRGADGAPIRHEQPMSPHPMHVSMPVQSGE
jgi:hypothetical protein